jgi:hypothetical protein
MHVKLKGKLLQSGTSGGESLHSSQSCEGKVQRGTIMMSKDTVSILGILNVSQDANFYCTSESASQIHYVIVSLHT